MARAMPRPMREACAALDRAPDDMVMVEHWAGNYDGEAQHYRLMRRAEAPVGSRTEADYVRQLHRVTRDGVVRQV